MKKMKNNTVTNYSIKILILVFQMLCWVIPFLLITGITVQYIAGNHSQNKINSVLSQLEFYSELSEERLNSVITDAKLVSYDGDINTLYKKMKSEKIGRDVMVREGNIYLRKYYSVRPTMEFAMIWFEDESAESYYCSAVNLRNGGSYGKIRKYWETDHRVIANRIKELDTGIGIYAVNGRVYLFRNLMDDHFKRIGTFVIKLNEDYCFGHLKNIGADTSAVIQFNGDTFFQYRPDEMEQKELEAALHKNGAEYFWEKNKMFLQKELVSDDFRMLTTVKFQDSSIYEPLYGYKLVLAGMLMVLIPLFIVDLRIFRMKIQEPVEALMYAFRKMEQKRFGFQLSENMGSKEFYYLQDSFNEMSKCLKDQFDYIYEEEIALRDAKIMALQSHINPHFMNNTLEIINWEARMAGANKVSEMISALGTLMDATTDRKKRPEVTLREEMKYVNAYFYITCERLGDRLAIYNEIPEEVMDYKVPRLILQPVIENAIEHGVVRMGKGTVTLNGYREGKYLYLEIINDAFVEDFDEEKVARLLKPGYDTSKESSGNIGIANVNQRLKILYGEPCGLTIQKLDDRHIIARLTILADNRTKKYKK